MNANSDPAQGGQSDRGNRWIFHLGARILAFAILLYLACAYLLVPYLWRRELKRHPDLSGGPRVTRTANGIPGDPVNLALIGSKADLMAAMLAAQWFPADPITLRSSLRIAVDSVFKRPDMEAPVSNLFLFGRKEDLAFEQPVGNSPRQRHHVRFWRWESAQEGREVWFGAATFDTRVGFSHTTGQITHHIGPEIDAERNRILSDLERTGFSQEIYFVEKFQPQQQGRNGGGDPWRTDGKLGVGLLRPSPEGIAPSKAGENSPR